MYNIFMIRTLGVLLLIPLILILIFSFEEHRKVCSGGSLAVVFSAHDPNCEPGKLHYIARGSPAYNYITYYQGTGKSGFDYLGFLLNYIFYSIIVWVPYLLIRLSAIMWQLLSKMVKGRGLN